MRWLEKKDTEEAEREALKEHPLHGLARMDWKQGYLAGILAERNRPQEPITTPIAVQPMTRKE